MTRHFRPHVERLEKRELFAQLHGVVIPSDAGLDQSNGKQAGLIRVDTSNMRDLAVQPAKLAQANQYQGQTKIVDYIDADDYSTPVAAIATGDFNRDGDVASSMLDGSVRHITFPAGAGNDAVTSGQAASARLLSSQEYFAQVGAQDALLSILPLSFDRGYLPPAVRSRAWQSLP